MAQTTTWTRSQTGTVNGYDYELWSQDNKGTFPMKITGDDGKGAGKVGGTFEAQWSNTQNVLFRSGRKFSTTSGGTINGREAAKPAAQWGNITVDFAATWSSPDDVKMLGVYGWAFFAQGSVPTKQENGTNSNFSNQIEYYIIQDRGSYNSATQGTNSKKYGEATIDGIVYELRVCDRIGQPMLTGNGNFKQYFSVPKNTSSHRQSGIISVSKHFEAWAAAGMKMDGNLYEVAMKVESYKQSGASGSAKVTKNILTVGGDPNNFTLTTTASPAVGGTITKTPNSASHAPNANVSITAVPAEGWAFNGWSGGASGTNATTSVTMNADKNVTANFKPVGVSTTSILKDGNFPAGSIGTSWTLNTGTNYGNSAATSSISGGKATINVTTIGEQTYQPQLIQKGVALDEGMKYRLTFTASATAPRSMSVDIQKDGSVDGSNEYTSYAANDFDLTTTPQEFKFEFEMKNADDPAAQFAFNLGAAATGVTLSEVKLVHIAEFEPEVMVTLTFDANEGTMQGVNSITVAQGAAIGTLPIPTRTGYSFRGWFDSKNVEYTADTKLTADVTVIASWKEEKDLSGLTKQVSDLQEQIDVLTSETENLQQLLDDCSK
nr:endo-1,4-beta-xylanase precursor [uncultured bacterium]